MKSLPEEDEKLLKKRNRLRRLAPKTHRIMHESGKSTKNLWRQITERSQRKRLPPK